jgi:hypothetical protein
MKLAFVPLTAANPDDEVQKGGAVGDACSFELPIPRAGSYLHVVLGEHLSASVGRPD